MDRVQQDRWKKTCISRSPYPSRYVGSRDSVRYGCHLSPVCVRKRLDVPRILFCFEKESSVENQHEWFCQWILNWDWYCCCCCAFERVLWDDPNGQRCFHTMCTWIFARRCVVSNDDWDCDDAWILYLNDREGRRCNSGRESDTDELLLSSSIRNCRPPDLRSSALRSRKHIRTASAVWYNSTRSWQLLRST